MKQKHNAKARRRASAAGASPAELALLQAKRPMIYLQNQLARHMKKPDDALLSPDPEDNAVDDWLKAWASLIEKIRSQALPALGNFIARPRPSKFKIEARRRTAMLISIAIPMFEGLMVMSGAAITHLRELVDDMCSQIWVDADTEELETKAKAKTEAEAE